MSTRALPERYRKVRNIDEGFQVRADCEEHNGGHWLTVTSALHILGPLKVSTFQTDAPGCVDNLRRWSASPSDEIMSRKPAVSDV